MDRAARLIGMGLLCGFLLLFGASSARAFGEVGKDTFWSCSQSYTTNAGTRTFANSGGSPSVCSSTVLAAIQFIYADPFYGTSKPVTSGPTCSGPETLEGSCWVHIQTAQGSKYLSIGVKASVQCGANTTTLENGRCECQLGSKNIGGKCMGYTCGASGSYSAMTQKDIVVENVGPQCMDGCEVNPSSVKGATDGTLYATWPYVATGQFCGGKASDTTGVKTGESKVSDAPIPCGANLCPGNVNGVSMCVACKDTTIKGPSTSASAPGSGASGSGSTGTTTTTTTETETKCTQSVCTTTTTTKDGNGNVVSQKKEEKGQESFCKENPDATICVKSGWGGACGAFTCKGDAVQCALAERVHKSACDWEQVDQSLKDAGNAAMGGGLRPEGHPFANADSSAFSFQNVISTGDALGGGGCPSDVVVNYVGRSFVIPWSQHCSKLQMIGNLMVGVCMLAAAMIVFRS